MNNWSRNKVLLSLGWMLILPQAWAATITDVSASNVNQQQKVIKIQFKGKAVTPESLFTDAPNRLALDFKQTDATLKTGPLSFNDTIIAQINTASDGNRTRVVVDLNQKITHRIVQKNKAIWVYLTGPKSSKAATAPVAVKAIAATTLEKPRYEPVSVKVERFDSTDIQTPQASAVPIDFRFNKGKNGEGIINLTLTHDHPQPKIQKEPNALVLTFTNMPIASEKQRTFDVKEFTTPVKSVSLKRLGNNAVLTIKTDAAWDYSTQDKGNAYMVTVSPQANLFDDNLDDKIKPKSFKGGRVSLDFQDIEVRTILQILAKESGMNIVASDAVQGKMTLSLKDVPWDQALDLVMQSQNLDMRRQGKIINIAPRQDLLNQDRQILQSQKELSELGPLSSRTFQLKYKGVEQFQSMLDSVKSGAGTSGNSNSILSSRGSIMVDSSTNTLIVTDNAGVLNKFDRLVTQLDVPSRQVMIEARIVEANEDFSRDLGVRFGGSHSHGSHSVSGPNFGGNLPSDVPAAFGNPNINLPAAAATSGLTFVRRAGALALSLELTAMQDEQRGKIVSSPRVLTQDRQEAMLEEGTDVPYEHATSSGATAVTFKKAVTGLTVTPQITPDGNVIMKLKINKDSLAGAAGAMSVKRVETTAMVENGGTMVVGGIYVEENRDGASKVPFFGDLPIIGNLFKQQLKSRKRRELLIFITPRIIDTMDTSFNY